MPFYTFENNIGEILDIFYSMKDVPSLGSNIEIDGVKWKRVFTKPNVAVSTANDPYSAKDFNRNLDGKKVTIGDMFDASKEASEKRAAKDGIDPIKQRYYDNYAKERKGVRHINEAKENTKRDLSEFNTAAKKMGIDTNIKLP